MCDNCDVMIRWLVNYLPQIIEYESILMFQNDYLCGVDSYNKNLFY